MVLIKLLIMKIVKFIYETLNNAERFTKMFNIRAEDLSVKTLSVVPISTCGHITNANASSLHIPWSRR